MDTVYIYQTKVVKHHDVKEFEKEVDKLCEEGYSLIMNFCTTVFEEKLYYSVIMQKYIRSEKR